MFLALIGCAVLFVSIGVGAVWGRQGAETVESFVAARGEFGTGATTATLFASSMGTWVLFGPPEAATWGGLPAIVGYALGSALPSLAYIPLGRRLRTLMPAGHALPEYVRHRYGRAMYAGTLAIMAFYLFVALSAQVTGMAFLVRLVAEVPLWGTAAVVLVATGGYTALGGLRASVVTDGVQSVLLLPLLAGGAVLALWTVGGPGALADGVAERAPALLQWSFVPGVQGGAALVIGIGAASLFNQGTWQRVYAAADGGTLRTGFLVVAGAMAVTVMGTGLLGLAAVGEGAAEPASTALFNLLLEGAPGGIGIGVIFLGLTLVMSSADTVLNALGSLGTVALRELRPGAASGTYLRAARWTPVVLAVPVYAIAAQGISVLYLFLIADLVCAAALVPVFGGLFSARITNGAAVAGTTAGLVVGGLLFPAPGAAQPALLPAFAAALFVPALVVGAVTLMSDAPAFDFATLRHEVTTMEE